MADLPGKPKGLPKTGGRVAGTPNKVTSDVREKFRQLIDMFSIQQLHQDLMSMEPKDRIAAISGLSEYIVAKLARIEIDAHIELKTVSETTIFQIKPKGQ